MSEIRIFGDGIETGALLDVLAGFDSTVMIEIG